MSAPIFVENEIVLSVPPAHPEEFKQAVMTTFRVVKVTCTNDINVLTISDSAGPAEDWADCK
ncbi:hypothetical protein ACOJA0_04175 [Corynebacterium amycolatum]|uniref:hypothetical protein n=1 Tax=Corynebacterium amycolatum TaxID=43765 RepID=UPI003B5BEB41